VDNGYRKKSGRIVVKFRVTKLLERAAEDRREPGKY